MQAPGITCVWTFTKSAVQCDGTNSPGAFSMLAGELLAAFRCRRIRSEQPCPPSRINDQQRTIGASDDDFYPSSDLRRLRDERSDWLLTVLTGVLVLLIFVFAPLQAVGISALHLFIIGLLLAIIGSMVVISNSPTALVLMSIALIANVAVFFLRLYYPVPFHLHILCGAWLIIAVTLGIVVTQAVFRRGRITYHRIIGAILCIC